MRQAERLALSVGKAVLPLEAVVGLLPDKPEWAEFKGRKRKANPTKGR